MAERMTEVMVKRLKRVIDHIYEHPSCFVIHGEAARWFSLRPMGEASYWLESSTGEGTQVKQEELFQALQELFRDVM